MSQGPAPGGGHDRSMVPLPVRQGGPDGETGRSREEPGRAPRRGSPGVHPGAAPRLDLEGVLSPVRPAASGRSPIIELLAQLTADGPHHGHTAWPVAGWWTSGTGRSASWPRRHLTLSDVRPLPGGRTQRKVLEVDVIGLTEARQAEIRGPRQALASGIAVCASIAAVGALFERHGPRNLDWVDAKSSAVCGTTSAPTVIHLHGGGSSLCRRSSMSSPYLHPLLRRGQTAGTRVRPPHRMALWSAAASPGAAEPE